jgi:hypothetical protein
LDRPHRRVLAEHQRRRRLIVESDMNHSFVSA